MNYLNVFKYREEVIQTKPKKSLYFLRDLTYASSNHPSWDHQSAYHKKQAVTYYFYRNIYQSDPTKMSDARELSRLITHDLIDTSEGEKFQTTITKYIEYRVRCLDHHQLIKVQDLLLKFDDNWKLNRGNLEKLGLILKNCGRNTILLRYFQDFTQDLMTECESSELWKSFQEDNNYTIDSLESLIRDIPLDSNNITLTIEKPIEIPIEKPIEKSIEKKILDVNVSPRESISDNQEISEDIILSDIPTTPEDIACLFYKIYGKHLFLINNKGKYHDIYYYFQNHLWREIDGKGFILEQLRTRIRDILKKHLKRDNQKIDNIITQTKDQVFKKNIIDECREFFSDKNHQLIDLFDSFYNYIGFNNGIYDLSRDSLRGGEPGDYVSVTTNYDYIDFTMETSVIVEILEYLNDILGDQKFIENLLGYLKSFLDGYQKITSFIILKGPSSNSRKQLLELIRISLGNYIVKLPISLITIENDFNPLNSEMLNTRGKRLAVFELYDSSKEISITQLEELTNREVIVTRKHYNEPIEFRPQFDIIISCREFVGTNDNIFDIKANKKINCNSINLENWKQGFMWLILNYHNFKIKDT